LIKTLTSGLSFIIRYKDEWFIWRKIILWFTKKIKRSIMKREGEKQEEFMKAKIALWFLNKLVNFLMKS
jgi:hypothetical protein